jgi:hypothetical protein
MLISCSTPVGPMVHLRFGKLGRLRGRPASKKLCNRPLEPHDLNFGKGSLTDQERRVIVRPEQFWEIFRSGQLSSCGSANFRPQIQRRKQDTRS